MPTKPLSFFYYLLGRKHAIKRVVMERPKNIFAVELGRLGGIARKTMTPAAIEQRKNASQCRKSVKEAAKRRKAIRQRKINHSIATASVESGM